MTRRQALGPVMIDVAGTEVSAIERDRLRCPSAGGVILFKRNYENPEQIFELIRTLRSIRPELLIAVDHEGGRVQRFRDGFTRLPAAAIYHQTTHTTLVETAGWLMASELRAIDVDFSFAPVLDVECGISRVIGDRAFGTTPEIVAKLAREFALGMRRAGMSAVGKHFPGHGGVVEDSHLALPVDTRDMDTIEHHDLIPFRELLAAHIEGIMPAHVIYEKIDSNPAGFSKFWIQEVLRKRLGFEGAVFSDDLSMAGAAYGGNYVDRSRLALEAGCDMILVCNAPGAAEEVLESLENMKFGYEHARRLELMRGKGKPIDRKTLMASEAWREASELISQLAET